MYLHLLLIFPEPAKIYLCAIILAEEMFTIEANDRVGNARAGVLVTDHGELRTPLFMPVGTVGTVKGVLQGDLKEKVDAPIILGNTYHLYLRPGTDILRDAGGLHKFINWDRALLTDSGGYQVFSLSSNRRLKEEGAYFKSHIDGSAHLFTPENVVDTQRVIGADIIMAFDECTPWPCDYNYARRSMGLTHRWLDRVLKRYAETEPLWGHEQYLFPIVQGGLFRELRKISAEKVAEAGMEGNAIGGLSVGEPVEEMYAMIEVVNEILPASKPRYLMGVGTPVNILEGIDRGIDLFDCVMPTRNGRNGMLFTSEGIINIKNKKWERDFSPLDPGGVSEISSYYTKGYLRHLFAAGELTGLQIASIHNLAFYLWLVRRAREHIIAGDFSEWKSGMVRKLGTRL